MAHFRRSTLEALLRAEEQPIRLRDEAASMPPQKYGLYRPGSLYVLHGGVRCRICGTPLAYPGNYKRHCYSEHHRRAKEIAPYILDGWYPGGYPGELQLWKQAPWLESMQGPETWFYQNPLRSAGSLGTYSLHRHYGWYRESIEWLHVRSHSRIGVDFQSIRLSVWLAAVGARADRGARLIDYHSVLPHLRHVVAMHPLELRAYLSAVRLEHAELWQTHYHDYPKAGLRDLRQRLDAPYSRKRRRRRPVHAYA